MNQKDNTNNKSKEGWRAITDIKNKMTEQPHNSKSFRRQK
jgi:hypothetical protein